MLNKEEQQTVCNIQLLSSERLEGGSEEQEAGSTQKSAGMLTGTSSSYRKLVRTASSHKTGFKEMNVWMDRWMNGWLHT
ncbi:MAG: hypothetical protein FRX49_09898 [Trebouxia sp. A1-2]|nr:MAG: hypothetical protein FRX49_09898 [Trebouxia sp. A1-2]